MRATAAPAIAWRSALSSEERAPQHPLSLRFRDDDLERQYQLRAGAEGLAGLRIITATSAVLWLVAALVIPVGSRIPVELSTPVALAMSALSMVALFLSERAETVDAQHALASLLTSANGLVILWLASAGGVLPGYGISAVMLLFAWGFVSRTRFVFAVGRSAAIAVGFGGAVFTHPAPASLLIDVFIFVAAVVGMLLALRLLEQSKRRVFVQDLVIREQSEALEREKAKSDRLLHNVLPATISTRLLDGEQTIAEEYASVSVLFADIVGFTPLAARLEPAAVIDLLDHLFAEFDDLVAERSLEKIKTMGDSYMVAGGLPEPLDDHAERIVDLGLAMVEVAARHRPAGGACSIRVGVHSGPVLGGVIGRRKFAFDLWGDTVNIASRLESHGIPNRVHVSDATWRLVRDRFDAQPRGPIQLRGKGVMETYTIVGRAAATP